MTHHQSQIDYTYNQLKSIAHNHIQSDSICDGASQPLKLHLMITFNVVVRLGLMTRIKMHISKVKLPFYPPCEIKCGLQNRVPTTVMYRIHWISIWKYTINNNLLDREFLVKWWDSLSINHIIYQIHKDFPPLIQKAISHLHFLSLKIRDQFDFSSLNMGLV